MASYVRSVAKLALCACLFLLCVQNIAQSPRPAPAQSPASASGVLLFPRDGLFHADGNANISPYHPYPLDRKSYIEAFGANAQTDETPDSTAQTQGLDLLALIAQARQGLAKTSAPASISTNDVIPATTQPQPERYHWKGLLWQSFAFFGVENSFRLMTDPYFRHLTADKPFWHDYIASFRQWNMRRWSDGDDFLVAYIGHPMQGSVTEFIEIQNDPSGRDLRISRDPAYWKSIFKAFLWATAFSTDQKIGPLGETALGSEGGYTYPIGCPAPCPSYNPATYKVTNNTGWVKFITTPVIGTLWALNEDFLDRYVSDRVQGDNRNAVFPKILRGSLNPTRTMANAMRGRLPWYRDFQQADNPHRNSNIHFLPDDDAALKSPPRFQLFPHFNALSLPVNTPGCGTCRRITTGAGVEFSTRIASWADFDMDVSNQPNASPLPSDRAGGSLLLATFGLRVGFETDHFALKFAVRPGLASYSDAYLASPDATTPIPEVGRITHFTTTLAISTDYNFTRHFGIRSVIGNTPIRYRTNYSDIPPGRGTEPYLFFISHQVFATNSNWTYQAGPKISF